MADRDPACPDLDRFTYLAVDAVVDRIVTIGEADSVREAWYDAFCVCDWQTSGSEPNVEDAAHEHVGEKHKAEVDEERAVLAAARAYCEAGYSYPPWAYVTPEDRERHIQADTASTACEERFRVAITAATGVWSALAAAAGPPQPPAAKVRHGRAACTEHPDCWVRPTSELGECRRDGVEVRPALVVRRLGLWYWLVRDVVGVRFVPGDPGLGSWWRYVLVEPADAAYALPRLAACRWLGRHGPVCVGRRDAVHLAWRRELAARRASGKGR